MLRRIVITCFVMSAMAAPADARAHREQAEVRPIYARIKDIVSVQGVRSNQIVGYGLVIGLNGTGEANDPTTMLAIQRAVEVLGSSKSTATQQESLNEFRKFKNVALVMVTAELPPADRQSGMKQSVRRPGRCSIQVKPRVTRRSR